MCVRLRNEIGQQLQGGLLVLSKPVDLGQTNARNEGVFLNTIANNDSFLQSGNQLAQFV